jgi:hypothetical protein
MPPFEESLIARRLLASVFIGALPPWLLAGLGWTLQLCLDWEQDHGAVLLAITLFGIGSAFAAGVCATVAAIFLAAFVEFWIDRSLGDLDAANRVALGVGFLAGVPTGMTTAWVVHSSVGYIGP